MAYNIIVGTQTMQLPKVYTLYRGGVDEEGLTADVLKWPSCGGSTTENIVFLYFSVKNALRFSKPCCDCIQPKFYIVFKTSAEVDEFLMEAKKDSKFVNK